MGESVSVINHSQSRKQSLEEILQLQLLCHPCLYSFGTTRMFNKLCVNWEQVPSYSQASAIMLEAHAISDSCDHHLRCEKCEIFIYIG